MATASQIAANRRNALFSTGPRTEAGKEIASQNAVTHGLTGQTICRQSCQDDAYNAYYESMLPELAPATALELDFAKRIIHDSWRLNRAGAMDDNLLQDSICTNHFDRDYDDDSRAIAEARAFRTEAKTIALLSLYEQRLQRAILKNLAALKTMQKERKSQPHLSPQKMLSFVGASAAARAPQPIGTPTPLPEIGSVYSTPPSHATPPPVAASNGPEIMAA